MRAFRWIDWNLEHIDEHGVRPNEVEYVVNHARHPYPERREDEKWMVWGSSESGRYLQVIYIEDSDDTVFVIHARPLTDREKPKLRRRRR